MNGPLLSSIVIFFVSLIGAYVTFGLLESTGAIKDEKIQLGGTIVGFVVIFYMLSSFYKTQNVSDLHFTFKFPDEYIPKFNEKINGKWEILNNGESVDGGNISVVPNGGNGWVWRPPVKVEPNSTFYLRLVEDDGKIWIGKPTSYTPVELFAEKKLLEGDNNDDKI